ncbi:MAG: acetyl-CoA carboxylase biotin carboxyl carrier protein subunit [Candidatus Marinimicrobia bacterium]|nr:acetyl-CoA carboxylase biotin carboxyl carrier protein subunit [Candidatus Neomarinimicrobiota bacterium]
MKFEINSDEKSLQVDFQANGEKLLINAPEGSMSLDVVQIQAGVYSVLMNNRSFVIGVCPHHNDRVNVNGTPVVLELLDAVHLHLRELGWDTVHELKAGLLSAQIPGLITKIFHKIGDKVNEGEPLFLIEAMKMENEIKAPVSGEIQRISVKEGQTVEKGTIIIEIG